MIAIVAAIAGIGLYDGTWRPRERAGAEANPDAHRDHTLAPRQATAVSTLILHSHPASGRSLRSPAMLPAGARRGLAHSLRQYPTLSLATPDQWQAAERLRILLWQTARRWQDPRAAEAAGFDTRRPRRRPGDRSVLWFHSENRAFHSDRFYLDARRPDTLIYADTPGRPLVLVGVMISMPRGLRGPTPGGPITRWHWHLVCAQGARRGLKPLGDGSCPRGSRLRLGSEMMHIWFTRDLRSAFAIHAPRAELCIARLLPATYCEDGATIHGM